MKQHLEATVDDIKLECVLVQAWKKASAFIRYHNWYSDTLELDYQSLRLPQFIGELQEWLEEPWETTLLRIVPAPKSQKWKLFEGNVWKQRKGEDISDKLRPLAHVALTASICYDSTDVSLSADLWSRSDIYSVCALNKDVGTFDRMSESLHYHMFQGMLVANNGEYGGSNCYMPFSRPERRQVLHLHGQPQSQIAFVEIDPEKMINRPNGNEHKEPKGEWKKHPAGWTPF